MPLFNTSISVKMVHGVLPLLKKLASNDVRENEVFHVTIVSWRLPITTEAGIVKVGLFTN